MFLLLEQTVFNKHHILFKTLKQNNFHNFVALAQSFAFKIQPLTFAVDFEKFEMNI